MTRRGYQRTITLHELHQRPLLEALRQCRKAIIESHRHLKFESETYRVGGEAISAIDNLAEVLTGDRRLFHAGSSAR